jgi:hypothetical protein
VPAKLIDLIIVDPFLDGEHKGPLWTVEETVWDAVTVLDLLRTLAVQNRKFTDAYTVVVYSTVDLAHAFTQAFSNAHATDVRYVGVNRIGPDFKSFSSTLAIVGTFGATKTASTSKTSVGDVSAIQSLTCYLPPVHDDANSVFGRQDISGCTMGPQQVGYRRRCVEEFRYFVREYSTKNNWVMCMHTVDGSCLLASLLEGRNVVGLEDIAQRLGAATWRLELFRDTESTLLKYRRACMEQGTDEDAMHVEVQKELAANFLMKPSKPDEGMLAKVAEELKVLRQGGAAFMPKMDEDEWKEVCDLILGKCTNLPTAKMYLEEHGSLMSAVMSAALAQAEAKAQALAQAQGKAP